MKKNLIIIILSLITALSITYGYIKAFEAEKNLTVARENQLEAERQAELATKTAAEAKAAQAEAERIADELEQCQSK